MQRLEKQQCVTCIIHVTNQPNGGGGSIYDVFTRQEKKMANKGNNPPAQIARQAFLEEYMPAVIFSGSEHERRSPKKQ